MTKNPARIIRAVIIALIVIFTALCICFIPVFADYISSEILPCNAARIAVFIGGTALALPCAAMLAMALRLPSAVAQDKVFTPETASLLSRIAAFLFIDCVLFLSAVIALFIVGEYLVSPLLAIVDLIGFALAFLFYVLADYIRRAAVLKEEVDSTL